MRSSEWNWAGNLEYGAASLRTPTNVDELSALVRNSRRVKALGTRHCFNDIADTDGDLVSTAQLTSISMVEGSTVTIGSGVRYGDLAGPLNEQGFALHNLASLPHISVVGACITATHGSGNKNGCLSTAVELLRIVGPDGVERVWSEETEGARFKGAVVSLGALGIVTEARLKVQPAFEVKQTVYDDMPLEAIAEGFDEITGAGYSVSLFTDWRAPRFTQVWVKQLAGEPELPRAWLGATAADSPRHPLPGQSTVNCTEQLGVPGLWSDRLPHFRMHFTPSAGEELQSEYFVDRRLAVPAILAVFQMAGPISAALQVTEIRCIQADEFWMSPFYRQDSVAIHFTWRKDWGAVRPLLPVIEERLAEFGVRPHWGKLFHMSSETLMSRYPRSGDFVRMVQEQDPEGKFANSYLKRVLGVS